MGYISRELFPHGFGKRLEVAPIKPVPPVTPDPDTEDPKPDPQPPIPPPPSIEDPPPPGTSNRPVWTPPVDKPAANARARHPVGCYFLGTPVSSRG